MNEILFRVGDRVYHKEYGHGIIIKKDEMYEGLLGLPIRFDGTAYISWCDASSLLKIGRREIRPNTQLDLLLKHLLKGSPITRYTAHNLYRIGSLSRRICDLKDLGYPIKSKVKVDQTGRPYTEYFLKTKKYG